MGVKNKLMKRFLLFIIILFSQEFLSARLPDLIPYRKGNLWGYCDSTKKMIIPCQFQFGPLFLCDSVWTSMDKKIVCVKKNGEILSGLSIPRYWNNYQTWMNVVTSTPCSQPISYFDTLTHLYGYKNCNGELVISCKYIFAEEFNEGLAGVAINDSTWGCINTAGTLLFSMKNIVGMNSFHSGTAIFAMTNKTNYNEVGSGIIDQTGKILFPPIASELQDAGNCIIAKPGAIYFLLDRRGNMVYKKPFDKLEFGDFETILATRSGKTGFLDKNGKVSIPFIYDDGNAFFNGFASVCLNGRWGFINKNGKVVIPIQYERPYPLYSNSSRSFYGFDQTGLVQMGTQGFIDIHGTEYWED